MNRDCRCIKRGIILLTCLVFMGVVGARAQDMKKVISIVERLETNLNNRFETEQKERKAEIALLKAELDALTVRVFGKKALPVQAPPKLPVDSSLDPLQRLKSGNARFVGGTLSQRDPQAERAGVVAGQHPYAIVLTCSDSRVPPELIFDESLGQLFVVRDAGNVLDSVVLGSIEYAAEHLGTKLLVVMGHQSCGAVKATIAGGEVPPNIASVVRRVAPAVAKMKGAKTKESELLDASILENVRMQVDQIHLQSRVLVELQEKSELTVVGGVYNLETGKVTFLEPAGVESRPLGDNITTEHGSHGH
jgi:carbonic anhydrase